MRLLVCCRSPSRALLCRYAQQPQAFDVHVIRHINPALEGEALALHLSQIITFMEYDMHSLIIAKLRCLPAHFFTSVRVCCVHYPPVIEGTTAHLA
jgi:hypothetical protein